MQEDNSAQVYALKYIPCAAAYYPLKRLPARYQPVISTAKSGGAGDGIAGKASAAGVEQRSVRSCSRDRYPQPLWKTLWIKFEYRS
jgi:hypothetical protein